MNRLLAICGINCAECEAYQATQASDEAAKERVAAKWRVQYNAPNIDAAYVTCDGCLTVNGRKGGHCLECDVRACGVGRGLPTCAHCADYDTCQTLAGFLSFAPFLRASLDEIRHSFIR